MNIARFVFLLAFIPVFAAGCQKPAGPAQAKQYEITGKVVAIDADRQTVTLDHQDIPGLMQGMEMEFKVASPQILEGIASGDQVQGRLENRSGEKIITALSKR